MALTWKDLNQHAYRMWVLCHGVCLLWSVVEIAYNITRSKLPCMLQCESSLLWPFFMLTLHPSSGPSLLLSTELKVHMDIQSKFKCTHLKFTVSSCKQASKQAYVHNAVSLKWGSHRVTPKTGCKTITSIVHFTSAKLFCGSVVWTVLVLNQNCFNPPE